MSRTRPSKPRSTPGPALGAPEALLNARCTPAIRSSCPSNCFSQATSRPMSAARWSTACITVVAMTTDESGTSGASRRTRARGLSSHWPNPSLAPRHRRVTWATPGEAARPNRTRRGAGSHASRYSPTKLPPGPSRTSGVSSLQARPGVRLVVIRVMARSFLTQHIVGHPGGARSRGAAF
jgi:hypothetical protein